MSKSLTRVPIAFWLVVASLTVGILGACQKPSKQAQLRRARAAYLKAIGAQSAVKEIETFFQRHIDASKRLSDVGLKSGGTSVDIPLMLALNGVKADDLKALEERGFDFVKALDPMGPSRENRRYAAQLTALQYELIIVGTIKSVELLRKAPGHEKPDGHGTTFRVRIEKTLKGEAPDSILTVRQSSGRAEGGGTQAITHYGEITDVVNENKNVRGRKYIFHLSNGLYDYLRSTHHDGQKMKSNYYRLGWANRYYSDEEEIGNRYAQEGMRELNFLIDNVNEADSKMEKLKR